MSPFVDEHVGSTMSYLFFWSQQSFLPLHAGRFWKQYFRPRLKPCLMSTSQHASRSPVSLKHWSGGRNPKHSFLPSGSVLHGSDSTSTCWVHSASGAPSLACLRQHGQNEGPGTHLLGTCGGGWGAACAFGFGLGTIDGSCSPLGTKASLPFLLNTRMLNASTATTAATPTSNQPFVLQPTICTRELKKM